MNPSNPSSQDTPEKFKIFHRFLFNDFFLWIIFILISGFFYFTSDLFQNINFLHTLLGTDSYNSYLFYSWKDPRFLDFNFQKTHPYSLVLSFFNYFLSSGEIAIFIFLDFVILFYFLIRLKLANFTITALWLLTCIFSFNYNGFGLLMWFQLGFFLIFHKAVKHKLVHKTKVLAYVLFYFLVSLIFLPGIFMIFFCEIINIFICSHEKEKFTDEILRQTVYFFIAVVLIILLHLSLAYGRFGIPANRLPEYLFLPFTANAVKYTTNNVKFFDAIIDNLTKNIGIYLLLGYAIFIWAFLLKDKYISIKLWIIAAFLCAGLSISRAESLFFPMACFFILSETYTKKSIDFPKKTGIIAAILFVVFIYNIKSYEVKETKIDVGNENLVISFADLQNLNFKSFGEKRTGTMKKIIIIDLKIIPENVNKLMKEIKLNKIDIYLNPLAMNFLENELKYEKRVMEQLTRDDYSIFIKSYIHPDNEQWPYRRIYEFWKILKKKDNPGKIIMF